MIRPFSFPNVHGKEICFTHIMCFHPCPSVCWLLVCEQDYTKTTEWISTKLGRGGGGGGGGPAPERAHFEFLVLDCGWGQKGKFFYAPKGSGKLQWEVFRTFGYLTDQTTNQSKKAHSARFNGFEQCRWRLQPTKHPSPNLLNYA